MLKHFLNFPWEKNNQRRYNYNLKKNKVKCPVNKWQWWGYFEKILNSFGIFRIKAQKWFPSPTTA